MKSHDTNDQRNKEGDVHKGLPEAAPNAGNAYEEDDYPLKDNADKHGKTPRHPQE